MDNEYIFMNKKYEEAVTKIKAQLFDIISNEEKKAMRIGLEMSREGITEEKFNKLQELAMKQGEDLGRIITLTSKLYDALVRLDSYTKILRDLRKEKSSTEEMEKNVQASAAEVITNINETEISQEEKNKMIENVGVMTDTAQVTVPEVSLAQETASEPVTPAPLEEDKVEAVSTSEVATAPVTEATPVQETTPAQAVPTSEVTPEPVTPAPLEEDKVEAVPTSEVATAPVTEATPVQETTPAQDVPTSEVTPEPVIPASVEENKVEAVPTSEVAAATVTEATPASAVPTSEVTPEPVIPVPVEENKVEAVPTSEVAAATATVTATIPVQETTPAPVVPTSEVTSAPVIPVPVEENKVEANPTSEVAAAPVTETTSAPVIPTSEVTSEPVIPVPVEATPSNVEAVEPSINVDDTVPLIPMPDESMTQNVPVSEDNVVFSTNNSLEAVPLNSVVDDSASNDVVQTVPEVAPVAESATVVANNSSNIIKFIKNDQNIARALLTSKKQISNLRNSLATQEALYSARQHSGQENNLENQLVQSGLLPADTDMLKKNVEQLMEQANALYKEGKTNEAQAMYDQISELNKQIQGKTNILAA